MKRRHLLIPMARVLVIGAGALGSLLGALLRERRHDVALVTRNAAHARTVTHDGLLVTGGAYGRPRRLPLLAGPEAPRGFDPDLVILAVKTQDVESALKEHATTLGERAPVVALQNGLVQDALVAAAVGSGRAVAAIAVLDAQFVEVGHVDCARAGTLVLSQGVPALADAVRVRIERDIVGARWTKLLINLGNVIPALTGLSFQQAVEHPGLARAHVRMIREGVRVAEEAGATLRALPWTSPWLLRATATLPEPLAARAYAFRVRAVLGKAPAYGSTWQSVQRGRPLETEWLNGEVVRRGAGLGIPTPANRAACALAQSGSTFSPDDAARELLR